MSYSESNLVWVDMEMTGLNPETDRVIEIATIVTDSQLNIVAEGPVLAIHQDEAVFEAMDDWNTKTHGESGLVDKCLKSHITEEEAVKQTIAFLEKYVPKGKAPLCGNSIGQDRRFMIRHMPLLEDYFHYRVVDVSTVKELVRRWKPEALDGFSKKGTHTALEDIRESIQELAYYRENVFCI
ncbi:oligoribonuclease [Alteromonas sp. a30]|uniref:oligoribonuclease n=1 Tax=Alteromonas sp. a30 TaxID=2730917 RepID=UPI002282A084|nr:oligoribonuclease [Alteromonas sp. a30]MCY7295364.1 oligoribonuclease [Alteromonas sp. a30]